VNELETFQVMEMTVMDLRVQKSHVPTKVDFVGFPIVFTVYWIPLIKFGEVLCEKGLV
jgi:hypothetical protein